MLNRTFVVMAAVTLALGGCEQRTQDKSDIKQVFTTYYDCNNGRDGAGLMDIFTDATFDRYGELVKLGLDGRPEQVRALTFMEKREVLTMRIKGRRADLEGMDGRRYVEHATSSGWYVLPEDQRSVDTLEDFRFEGESVARPMLVSDGEWTQIRPRFVKENGRWKLDEFSIAPALERLLRSQAKDLGMTAEEILIFELEEQFEKPLDDSIWQPMR